MKTYLLSLAAISLVAFSSIASAEKVTISGSPVVIEKKADVYVPATTVTTGSDYYYFTFDNSRRVCYKEVQPSLAKIDAGIFAVRVGPDVVRMHCYNYSPDYFVVE